MKICKSVKSLRKELVDEKGRIVLVPTMGALHEGHVALLKRGRRLAGRGGTLVTSLFVNPIQFDRDTDFKSYPRPLRHDLLVCRNAGVDLVFVPKASVLYPVDFSTKVSESRLTQGLCGTARPGHFDGVCTIVAKLFHVTGCDTAVFGQKDYQQLAVIRRMVRDLDFPVRIVGHPTVREPDGLAMSSRNTLLTEEARRQAPELYRLLQWMKDRIAAPDENPMSSRALISAASRRLNKHAPLARLDYLEIRDCDTLEILTKTTTPCVIAIAAFFGNTRLIDNAVVE